MGSAFGFALAGAASANPPPRSHTHATPRTGATTRTSTADSAPRNSTPSAVVSFAEQAARLKRGRRPTIHPDHDQSLVRWAEECVQPDHHGCVGARATYQSYCRWAENVGITAVSETKFGRTLTSRIKAMGGSKTKRREGTVYLGIRILQAPVPQGARVAA